MSEIILVNKKSCSIKTLQPEINNPRRKQVMRASSIAKATDVQFSKEAEMMEKQDTSITKEFGNAKFKTDRIPVIINIFNNTHGNTNCTNVGHNNSMKGISVTANDPERAQSAISRAIIEGKADQLDQGISRRLDEL
jgi:hypothetical protein